MRPFLLTERVVFAAFNRPGNGPFAITFPNNDGIPHFQATGDYYVLEVLALISLSDTGWDDNREAERLRWINDKKASYTRNLQDAIELDDEYSRGDLLRRLDRFYGASGGN